MVTLVKAPLLNLLHDKSFWLKSCLFSRFPKPHCLNLIGGFSLNLSGHGPKWSPAVIRTRLPTNWFDISTLWVALQTIKNWNWSPAKMWQMSHKLWLILYDSSAAITFIAVLPHWHFWDSCQIWAGSGLFWTGSVHFWTGSGHFWNGSGHFWTGSGQFLTGTDHFLTGSGHFLAVSVHN